jgi:2-keto-4-pentenoate hydratase
MITEGLKKELAIALGRAQEEHRPLAPLTTACPDLTLKDAYAIQSELLRLQLNQGSSVIGKKVGFTDSRIQQKLGLAEPGYGHLLNIMEVRDGEGVEIDGLFQPKVEGEVAFMLGRDLRGTRITIKEVLDATSYIVPAIEIIDSRISDWMKSAADTISDNALSCLFVKGIRMVETEQIDLPNEEMVVERNGEVVRTGTGAAVLGNPASSVAWLANKLSESGEYLKAGELILSGSLSAPLTVVKGDVIRVHFKNLGSVSVRFI